MSLWLPFALWTRESVVELVKKVTGRTVSVCTVGRSLVGVGRYATEAHPSCLAQSQMMADIRSQPAATTAGARSCAHLLSPGRCPLRRRGWILTVNYWGLGVVP
jgi:hypothetical protein